MTRSMLNGDADAGWTVLVPLFEATPLVLGLLVPFGGGGGTGKWLPLLSCWTATAAAAAAAAACCAAEDDEGGVAEGAGRLL